MRLADLEQLEQEYAARGWRVAFQVFHSTDRDTGDDCWLDDELTQDDGTGWPTVEEALEVCSRFTKVALSRDYRNIRVVGPDGQPWLSAPVSVAPPEPDVAAVAAVAPLSENGNANGLVGVADLDGMLSVLARDDERVLLGDQRGRVAPAPVEVFSRMVGAGRTFAAPRYTTFDSMLVGSTPVVFRTVDGDGLGAAVAFVGHDDGSGGVWMVKR